MIYYKVSDSDECSYSFDRYDSWHVSLLLLQELQIFSMRLQTLSESLFIPKDVQQCLWGICAYASALVFVEG